MMDRTIENGLNISEGGEGTHFWMVVKADWDSSKMSDEKAKTAYANHLRQMADNIDDYLIVKDRDGTLVM